MFHRQFSGIALASVAIISLSACGTSSPTATATVTTTVTVTAHPDQLLDVTPGALGPVHVGMTKQQAAATGLFDVDVKVSEPCPFVDQLRFKAPYYRLADVQYLESGQVASIGIHSAQIKTSQGIRIGSTYEELKQAYPSASKPESAGYDQTGVFVRDGEDWIGFLFNDKADGDEPTGGVTFIEVTHGTKPGLMRDGC